MKHLLASCAVVALMAAPALAQSTTPPNDPFSDTNVMVDPVEPEQPDVSIDAEVESDTDVTVTMAPDADEETVAEVETETDAEMTAEMEPEEDLTFQAEVEPAGSEVAETESETAVAVADEADDAGAKMAEAEAEAVEPVEAPVDVAELPEEYSTDDLNALMLAQLNQDAEEIASISFVSEGETFATAETDAMTETAPGAEAPVEDYAANQMETSVTPEAESYAYSETETDADVAPEAYAGTETETEATPQSDLAMTDTMPSDDSTINDYAANETGVDAGTSMMETVPSEEPGVQDYASSETGTYVRPETSLEPSDEAAIEDYAAAESSEAADDLPVAPEVETAMTPVSPALDDEATEMAGTEDETILMAEQEDGDVMIAQGDIDQNAVEIAAGDPRFSTLVELVGIAGLEDDLSMDGPYTVFAPTNDAFAALPAETLERLKSEEGKEELAAILKAHVVEGAVMAPDVPLVGEQVETLADTTESITGSTDGTLNIKGSNTIGDGIYASNGVVYAIDAVILPEATVEPVADETADN